MGGRRLSDKEAALWSRATKDVRRGDAARGDDRLAPSHARRDDMASLLDEPPSLTATRRADVSTTRRNQSKRLPAAPRLPTSAPSAWDGGGPQQDRRLAKRKTAVDRVLDLHGCTQATAQSRLDAFVREAYADGCRRLLVVTGKGGPASATNMARARMRGQSTPPQQTDAPRGVLRARMPEWIDHPSIRPYVARLAKAKPKDGGDGAFYIFLKRRKP